MALMIRNIYLDMDRDHAMWFQGYLMIFKVYPSKVNCFQMFKYEFSTLNGLQGLNFEARTFHVHFSNKVL